MCIYVQEKQQLSKREEEVRKRREESNIRVLS